MKIKQADLTPLQKELLIKAKSRPCGVFPRHMANGNTIKALLEKGMVQCVGYSKFCLTTIYGLTDGGAKVADKLSEALERAS